MSGEADNLGTMCSFSNPDSCSDNNMLSSNSYSTSRDEDWNYSFATCHSAPSSTPPSSPKEPETPRSGNNTGPTSPTPSIACETCAQLSQLEIEAFAAVREVAPYVRSISVSEVLTRTSELMFLNLVTLENESYCIELTRKGWRICSDRLDCMYGDFRKIDMHVQYYDTIYALLDNLSTLYRDQFTSELAEKLSELEQQQEHSGMENGGEIPGEVGGFARSRTTSSTEENNFGQIRQLPPPPNAHLGQQNNVIVLKRKHSHSNSSTPSRHMSSSTLHREHSSENCVLAATIQQHRRQPCGDCPRSESGNRQNGLATAPASRAKSPPISFTARNAQRERELLEQLTNTAIEPDAIADEGNGH